MSKKLKKLKKVKDDPSQKVWNEAGVTVRKIMKAHSRNDAGRVLAGWVTEMLQDYCPPIVGATYEEEEVRKLFLTNTTPLSEKWEDKLIASGATPEHLWEETEYGSRRPKADLMQILIDFGDEYLALMDNFFNRIDALEEACEA